MSWDPKPSPKEFRTRDNLAGITALSNRPLDRQLKRRRYSLSISRQIGSNAQRTPAKATPVPGRSTLFS